VEMVEEVKVAPKIRKKTKIGRSKVEQRIKKNVLQKNKKNLRKKIKNWD
jgi:hypothetical protein